MAGVAFDRVTDDLRDSRKLDSVHLYVRAARPATESTTS